MFCTNPSESLFRRRSKSERQGFPFITVTVTVFVFVFVFEIFYIPMSGQHVEENTRLCVLTRESDRDGQKAEPEDRQLERHGDPVSGRVGPTGEQRGEGDTRAQPGRSLTGGWTHFGASAMGWCATQTLRSVDPLLTS